MSHEQSPVTTVAMPVRNCAGTVGAALRSLLAQRYADFEVLVVDDASEDQTAEIVRAFDDPRIRLLTSPRPMGVAFQLNRCIDAGRGRFFARMDGDDVAYPRRFELQMAYLQQHPDVDLVGAQVLVFCADGEAIGKRPGRTGLMSRRPSRLRSIPVVHPTFFGRMAWFRRHRYETWSTHFQDQQLLASAAHDSTIVVLPEVLLGYREEALDWHKQVRYRLSHLRAFRRLVASQGAGRAGVLLAAQLTKLAIDGVAIASGLQYRLLSNRAVPLGVHEIDEWTQVWRSVAGADLQAAPRLDTAADAHPGVTAMRSL